MSSTPLTLNLADGSVRFNFTPEAARDLHQAIAQLMQHLKTASSQGGSGGRRQPQPQPPTEYRHAGEVFLEIFCNPNIYPSPFAAKVLITVRDDRIRLTTEIELTRLVEDLNLYLENA